MKKKAVEIKLLVTLIIVLLVIIMSLWAYEAAKKPYGFFSSLPDLFGIKKNYNLTENAVIYKVPVEIILNDGQLRCLVNKVINIDSQENDWLKSYGLALTDKSLIKKNTLNTWQPSETGIDWMPKHLTNVNPEHVYLIEKEKEILDKIKGYYNSFATSESESQGAWNQELAVIEYMKNNNPDSIGFFSSLDEKYKSQISTVVKNFVEYGSNEEFFISYGQKTEQKLVEEEINGEKKFLLSDSKYPNLRVGGGTIFTNENGIWTPVESNELMDFDKEKIKDQLIKQDLIMECFGYDEKLKDVLLFGAPAKIILKDKNKRCLVYESQDPSLEYYSLKYPPIGIFGNYELYKLNKDLKWKSVENLVLDEDENKFLSMAMSLIKAEKGLADYISNFEIKNTQDGKKVNNKIEPNLLNVIYRDRNKLSFSDIYGTYTFDELIRKYADDYNKNSNFKISSPTPSATEDGKYYLKLIGTFNKKSYVVSEGEIYTFEKVKEYYKLVPLSAEKTNLINLGLDNSDINLNSQIKNELKEKCRK
ncbi:MAG: hypothetical protein ACP5OG_04795 [Candidatus Nanoarchaeia archaeon]